MPVGADGTAEEASLPSSWVWLLTWGAHGDHVPFVPLALEIQRAGHPVRVFGQRVTARLFTSHGLAFEPIDYPVILHRRNEEARTWLRRQADAVGLVAEEQEEEYLLHLMMLKNELFCRKSLTAWEQEKSGLDFLSAIGPETKRFDDVTLRGMTEELASFPGFVEEKMQQCLEWQAVEQGLSIQECREANRERGRAFRAHVRAVATEVGWSPFDVLEAMAHEQHGLLMTESSKCPHDKAARMRALRREVRDIMKWQAGEDPAEYWQRWSKRLPAWADSGALGKSLMTITPVTMQNVLLTMAATRSEERPKLAVHHLHAISSAMCLHLQFGVKTILAWTCVPELKRERMVELFTRLLEQEEDEGVVFSPLKQLGPFAFCDLLHSSWQLVAQSASRLVEEALPSDVKLSLEKQESLRPCYTGPWVLDADPQTALDDAERFGCAQERVLLEGFLKASPEVPICMGWGSSRHPKGPKALATLVVKAARLVGRRCIFLAGWSAVTPAILKLTISEEGPESAELERRFLWLRKAPHEWLFPKCAAVVHHGGAGTTNAALLAGVPSVVAPVGLDQFDSARWVRSLASGRETQPLENLTFEELAGKLKDLFTDLKIQARVREVAEALRTARGAAVAAEKVSQVLDGQIPWLPFDLGSSAEVPWPNGLFGAHDAEGNWKWCVEFRGSSVFLGERQVSWLRVGDFSKEVESVDDVPGGFTVEAITPGIGITYASLGENGKVLTFEDGAFYRYEGKDDSIKAEEDEGRLKARAAISVYVRWVSRLDSLTCPL